MRYLPHTDTDRKDMLDAIGVASIDDLFVDVPDAGRLDGLIDLPLKQGELQVERAMSAMSSKNVSASSVPFFVGAGAYKHHIPSTVDHLIQRSEFLTAYTPYQPEISQGTLQTLFEFQTQVAQLTGMDVANASMYDGSTACAEAVMMAARVTRRMKAVMAGNVHPHYVEASKTLAKYSDVEIEVTEPGLGGLETLINAIDDETACVVVQTPDVFGQLHDLRAISEAAHAKGALVIAAFTEVVSLGLIEAPGAMGADIAVGEGQSIGVGLNFGGPYVGLFACKDDRRFIRQMPGRLAGETVDADGRRGFVLTLSTREQHIRRDKATSNICTNAGLCSLAFTIHMTLLGEKGLKQMAVINHETACSLADALDGIDGVEVLNDAFFNEFAVRLPKNANEVVDALAKVGVLAGVPASRLFPGQFEDVLLVAATEINTDEDIAIFDKALRSVL
ncbi:MAG: aminomethyl-transferring glycine dehydrogenase subunit GcvPA [Maricaulis sp.]|uniref:aminomethyl-transferring glycine dehydrogenase subunit GcvPA n=1 Tax=Maricaulis sp. TaxID=1486257 RepID=UPI001B0B76B1|nr:aminomethyl-transferring glycine dehydrogenase subunit GcvPA [Maricaulis sp.]MBO6847792.1 aminomethyl-transferring glycine dehydrogenase subunit GcvPA [Maricaulis sp.]MBO6877353.1 aminomethyl-transferring glycine dehydrogenase subunit GcvPA [Maricaulis sp.]